MEFRIDLDMKNKKKQLLLACTFTQQNFLNFSVITPVEKNTLPNSLEFCTEEKIFTGRILFLSFSKYSGVLYSF